MGNIDKFREDVIYGLSQQPKTLNPKYFYDALGCEIYTEIQALDSYYLPRTEAALLHDSKSILSDLLVSTKHLIEYGGGSGQRTLTLITCLKQLVEYIPIDIAIDQLEASINSLQLVFPNLDVKPLQGDFFSLPKLSGMNSEYCLGFLPGSTIGNFIEEEAISFLKRIKAQLGKQAKLIVGYDLIKEREILHLAYDDPEQVTSRFNLNLLTRMNRELGANFDLSAFVHHAEFNEDYQRMEMHLVSLKEQTIEIDDFSIHFEEKETIHTENSYKYTTDRFIKLASAAGWKTLNNLTSNNQYYALAILEAG